MKLYSLIFALIVGLTITACGNESTTTTGTSDSTVVTVDSTEIDSMEIDSMEVLVDTTVN